MEPIIILNNEKEQQFQVRAEGEIAFLEYRYYKGDIALMHTQVPDKLSGRGIASALAEYALTYARDHKIPVMVYCPFVGGYLKKHPEYEELVDKKYR
ncbi:MAG TPA: GNAT family N-acetyltransferase [Puia sp.]